jgi:hypothetical protein
MEALVPNRRLAGRYILEDPIATGGMAVVWRARDEVLARAVAVKCLRDELARDSDFAARFQREAVAAAHLTHPNIISVYDTGVDGGVSFIVMEYFPGATLHQLMEKTRPLEPARAIALILPVLTALGFAHSEGLVHRDVKPGNILVSPDFRVKVTDFGIAKALRTDIDLTTTGQVLGTVRYLAPEQVQGSEVDPRTDIYSTGVVLYEMVTGRPPFDAENDVATAMMRLTRDPLPPRAIRGGISRGVEVAILRAMARRPEDRFQSADAMRGALERLAGPGEPTPPRGIAPPTQPIPVGAVSTFRSWMLVPLVVILVAAVTIAGGLAAGRLKLGGPLGVRPAPKQTVTATPNARPIAIVGARDFDPDGDGSEDPNRVQLATDGDSGTAWTTEHYNSPEFGNLKQGVGLWVDLGRTFRLSRLTVTSQMAGWSFEVKTGTLPDRISAPLTVGGARTFHIGNGGTTTIDLPGVKARGLLIWITRLATEDGQFAAAVSEVSVTGSAQ